MVTALAIHDTPRHGLDGPDLNLKTSGRVSSDMAEITYGKPGFGNYAYVDTNEYLLHYVEPIVEIVTPPSEEIKTGSWTSIATTFGKSVVNGVTTEITSLFTIGMVNYRPFEITDQDIANGYNYMEGGVRIGANIGIAYATAGVGCAANLGSKAARAAVVTVHAFEAANAGRNIVEGGVSVVQDGFTLENTVQIICGAFGFVGLSSTKCFTVGTQIVVGAEYSDDNVFIEYTTKNIEDIQVGDLVFSYDTTTGEVSQNEVTDVFVRESDHINLLTIADEHGSIQVIETTDGHPFWVVTDEPDLSRAAGEYVYENGVLLYHENIGLTENGYWVSAKDLRPGDVFLGAHGELSVLVSAERIAFDETIKVYNFTVEGDHNYFVIAQVGDYGQTCILVHNASGIYEFDDLKSVGQKYVGQTVDFDSRLAQHIAAGRLDDVKKAVTKNIPGDKTVREIAEQRRIHELTDGTPARLSDAVSNKRDPIGPKRKHLLDNQDQ